MSLYLDSSALLKLYLDEPGSVSCERTMLADPRWITARHTYVEVRRSLALRLSQPAGERAKDRFSLDWARTAVIELDGTLCMQAAQLAEGTGVRSLDALHLAAARRADDGALEFLTYDRRQAGVARSLGWTVLGS